MKTFLKNLLAWPALLAAAGTTSFAAETNNFDTARVGAPPPGWTATQMGRGLAQWAVVADDSAPSKPNVLKQFGGTAFFPICLKDDTRIKDGFVEVKLKPVSGKQDQAGGVIWRCQDVGHYYLARANALETNVTIYTTLKGRRVTLKNAEVQVAAGAWHTLRVDFRGSQFTVTFDGKKVLEASDNSLPDAGQVGVWTKSDSVTLFDDFTCGGR